MLRKKVEMKEFSSYWLGSKNPGKQRKFRFNAPLHIKRNMLSATLSKPLRKEHKKRSLPVREGDSVKIMRGDFKGYIGKIDHILLKKSKVTLDSIKRKKANGSAAEVYFDPSNLMITEIKKDRMRINKPKKQVKEVKKQEVKKEVKK